MDRKDARRFTSLIELKKIGRITNWNDIHVGEIYHIPPLIYNERFDFFVLSKDDTRMRIIKVGDDYAQTMFKTDVTSNFIVKKWSV